MVINTNSENEDIMPLFYTMLVLLFLVNPAGKSHSHYSVPVTVSSENFIFQEAVTA